VGKGSSTTTSKTTPAPQAAAMGNTAWDASQAAASQPYSYYPGQLVANLNPDQMQAFNTVAQSQGIANPYINAASQLTSAATQPIGASQINQYMNPYIGDVVGTAAAEINQNNAIQQNQLQGNAAALGALGGNRVGIAQAALANQQAMAENQMLAGLYQGGYNTALQAAQTQNAQQLQGAYEYANLGTEAQTAALTGANAQIQTGGIEQQQQQNILNQAYSQWLGAQQYPFQTGQYLTNTAGTLAGLYGGQASTTIPAPSTFSQIVGGLTGVAGIVGAARGSKVGGRINNDLGGLDGYDNGGFVGPTQFAGPEAPPPYDPNKNVEAKAFGGRIGYDDGGFVGPTHFSGPQAPPPYNPNKNVEMKASGGFVGPTQFAGPQAPPPYDPNKKADGGRIGYDGGGGIPYQIGGIQAQDLTGMSHPVGYVSNAGVAGATHFAGPQAPQGYDPNKNVDQSSGLSKQQVTDLGSLYEGAKNYINGAYGPTMGGGIGGGTSDAAMVAHQGGQKSGGRVGRASGGQSGNTPSTGGLSGLTASLSNPTMTEGQQIENYQFLSPMISTGRAPEVGQQQQQQQESPLQEEQAEEQMLASMAGHAHGGRAAKAGGGSLGALPTPQYVGSGPAQTAPQPTTTAGTQPTSWGNVQMPTAPMLSAPQGAAPGTGQLPALGGQAAQNFAASYTGSQDPYAAYIQSLAGANPSAGNRAPGTNATVAQPQSAPAQQDINSVIQSILSQNASDASIAAERRKGGRTGYDLGGDVSNTPQDLGGVATPAPVTATAIPGISPDYVSKVNHIESGGNPAATSPTSTASGLGQITVPTAKALAPGLAGLSDQQVQQVVQQPAVSNDLTAELAKKNAAYLTANNLPANDGTVYLAHNFGAGGAKALLTADPNTPVENVLPKEDITANPDLSGKTVGQVIASRYAEVGAKVAQNTYQQPNYGGDQTATDTSPLPPIGGDQGLTAYQQQAGSAQYNLTQPQQTEVDKIANSPWMALAQAGLATMAGTSPFAAVNIGAGGLAGLQYLQSTQGQERQNAQLLANIQQNQAELQQRGLGQVLQGVQAGQNEQQIRANLEQTIINANPNYTQAQVAAEAQNLINAVTNQSGSLGYNPPVQGPQMPPGIVPGGNVTPATPAPVVTPQPAAPAPAPQTTAGAVGPAPQAPQQPYVAATPQFAQSATGIPPVGAATIDTSAPSPLGTGNMPLAQAYQMAQRLSVVPQFANAVQSFTSKMEPLMNRQGAVELQQQGNAAAQQMQNMDELAAEAAQIHTGPVTGQFVAHAVQAYEDISSAFGLPIDQSITASSDASQVLPKLSANLLATIGRMGSDVGGAETLRMMGPAVPTSANTVSGIPKLVQVYNTMSQRTMALGNYVNAAVSQNTMTYAQAIGAFNQQYPPAMWASHVTPLPLPDNVAALKPGFAYQANGNYAIWNGQSFQPMSGQ